MDDVGDDKTYIYVSALCGTYIQNEQINERINEGEEKAVKRKRGIFHANQINDNLCMYIYIYIYVYASITSRICIYQKLILSFFFDILNQFHTHY
jgi:hypothetical protein